MVNLAMFDTPETFESVSVVFARIRRHNWYLKQIGAIPPNVWLFISLVWGSDNLAVLHVHVAAALL